MSAVDHPPHYQTTAGIEAIDVIEAMVGLDGHAANAIKYLLRHQGKGKPAEDLGKARWYVRRLLASSARIEARDGLAVQTMDRIAAAFGVKGAARHALEDLAAALSSVAEDRYRAHLRSAEQALGRAIAAASVARGESEGA